MMTIESNPTTSEFKKKKQNVQLKKKAKKTQEKSRPLDAASNGHDGDINFEEERHNMC